MQDFFTVLFFEYPVLLISNLIAYDSTGSFYLTGTIRNVVLLIGLLSPCYFIYLSFLAVKEGEYMAAVSMILFAPLVFILISLSSVLVHVISGIIYLWINFLPATIAFTLLAIILVPHYFAEFISRDERSYSYNYGQSHNDDDGYVFSGGHDDGMDRRREEEYAWMAFNSNREHWE